MANISSQFKKASELYQRAVQQYQAKQKEQKALIDQFKVGDQNTKVKLKPQLIALHSEMQHHQELVDRAEAAFEKALAGEPVNLGEDVVVKNKKTGNVYPVKKANPAIHTKPTSKDIAKAKADNGGQVKAEPKSKAKDVATDMGVDSVVYNKRTKTVGIVRMSDERGETKTDADGNVNTDELEPYNPMKYPHQKDAKAAPSTSKEIDARGLWKPFSQSGTEPSKGPKLNVDKQSHIKDIPQKFRSMVSMKIDQLAKAASEAKAKGEKAPNFNLCDITIPGTNLYCKGNKGIPREDMPQFKGYAKPGSIADKLPKDNDGEVDTEAQFKVLLKRNGVAVSEPQSVPADQLKATQTELVGAKVAGMTKALETEPNHPKITAPIYVSNDGYVLDGHHRWAAVTSAAVASGQPAMMNVRVIDMPIKELVKISNDFADQIGIQQKKADANAEAPKKEVREVTTNDWHYKAIMSLWDKGGSFTRKKLASIICKDPKATRRDIEDELRNSDYDEVTDVTDRLRIEGIIKEDTDTTTIIKDLDKVRHDLIKKVDVLIAKKKKLYSNVDITTPMSADEKQLDKDIQSIFSQIQDLIQQKRKIKTESVNEDKVYIDYLNKQKGFKQDRIKFNSYEEAVKWARKNFEKFNPDMIKYESVNESWSVKDGNVLSNGKLIGYYDFDRDSDSFWVDDVKKGKGQLSFDTKKEVEDYFKKNEKDAVKHLGKLRESVNEDMDTTADESGMFISSITSAMESAQGIQQTIQAKGENFDVPAWVQAKTALASDYLHSINRYYKGNPDQD